MKSVSPAYLSHPLIKHVTRFSAYFSGGTKIARVSCRFVPILLHERAQVEDSKRPKNSENNALAQNVSAVGGFLKSLLMCCRGLKTSFQLALPGLQQMVHWV